MAESEKNEILLAIEKLDLLFDIFDMQQEKLKSHERRIQLCERHLDRHDDEIYYLKEFLRV